MITNIRGLPDALVRAITADPYTKGKSDFSVTELLQPPRLRALKLKHKDEIVEDAGDRIWSLLGQAVHTILERANDDKKAIAEKRYFSKFGNHVVSAQIDSLELDGAHLQDYKVTSVWKFIGNKPPPEEYVAQLNMQSEILRDNGIIAQDLSIVGILRDWNLRESKENENYPKFQVAVMSIPLWSRAKTIEFIMNRIALHLAAEAELPQCTAQDRWASEDRFAIMTAGKKRAVKIVDSMPEAHDYIRNMNLPSFRIESRPGVSRRCENYCVAKPFCHQYQQTLKQGAENETRNSR